MADAAWFDEAKFGMFIHWGVYAVRARGEWAIYRERIPRETYRAYRRRFNPDRFDADEWVAQAKSAGMKYLVITSKHHDGFCMFDARNTDWKVTNTPFGRDVIAEVGEACRRGGIGFGIYYSVWDIWHPGLDGGIGDDGRLADGWTPSEEGVRYMHEQVEQLLDNYGKVDLFWFDVRRAPGAAYRGAELMERIRALQPDVLINDRLVGSDADMPPADLRTPENRIPEAGLTDEQGEPIRWEACMCYNKNWGYVHDDRAYRGPAAVLANLVEIVSKGGNLLLNVGPNARGELPRPWYPEMFDAVGEWLDRNGESIYGARPAGVNSMDHFRWNTFCTRKGDTIYMHVVDWPSESMICFPRIDGMRFESMRLLDDGTEVRWRDENYLSLHPHVVTIELPRLPAPAPVTTIAIELAAE